MSFIFFQESPESQTAGWDWAAVSWPSQQSAGGSASRSLHSTNTLLQYCFFKVRLCKCMMFY